MNKNDFTNELKELMSTMSEEEIEKTITALSDCKSAVYKKSNKEKSERARLLSTTELHYVSLGKEKGTIKTTEASLLTVHDFNRLNNLVPLVKDDWWLYEGFRITGKIASWPRENATIGRIRPVIVIKDIQGNLKPGDVFYINNEKLLLLSPSLALKISCLEGFCTYAEKDYEHSSIRFCIDGWYMKLINDNKKYNLLT